MLSTAFAKTQFSKQPIHTSQKSILSFGTVILQKHLFHEDFRLNSATGVQQGNLLGPALFALAIHRVTSEVKSDLNVWNLDDGCIGGDPQTVLSNAAIIKNGLSSAGLEINNSKYELLIVNNTTSQGRSKTIKSFQVEFPSISIPAANLWQLLRSPLHQDSTPPHVVT